MCDQIGMQLSSFRLLIPLGLKVARLIERIGKGVLTEGVKRWQKLGDVLPEQSLISRSPS